MKEQTLTEALGHVQSYQKSINYWLLKIFTLSATDFHLRLPSSVSNTVFIFKELNNLLDLCNTDLKGNGNNTIDF